MNDRLHHLFDAPYTRHAAGGARRAMRAMRAMRAVLFSVMAVLLSASMAGCGGGPASAVNAEPRIEPYPGFYQAMLGEEVFLFADLEEKQRFDLEPAALTYAEFISRTGQRVYISNSRQELVPRIEVGYERAVDTELTAAGDIDAPPAAMPPPVTTRRTVPTSQPTTQPATVPATEAATRPSTLPSDRLGPTGDPPPRPD